MKAVLSGKEMKEFDARSIKGYGIPSLVLMERAAMAVAEKAEEILEKEEAGTGCISYDRAHQSKLCRAFSGRNLLDRQDHSGEIN